MSSPEAEAVQPVQATSPKSLIQTTMKDLFLHGQYSDMTVTCQGFTFKAHRSILCTQSDFFRGAMNGHFKEGITHTVDLPDDDLETVERVLSFLYFNDYNEKNHIMDLVHHLEALEDHPHPDWPTRKERATDHDLGGYTHAEVYVAADKFGIPPLKEFAIKRFQQWCAEYWKYAIFPVTLEHAIAIMPPHDEQFQNAIIRTLSADAAEILELDGMSKFLDSHGKVASGVLSRLVDDGKIWRESWGEYIANLINRALREAQCDRCGIQLQVKPMYADFEYLKFCCAVCERPYDNFQVGV